jgi:hypothetical protein
MKRVLAGLLAGLLLGGAAIAMAHHDKWEVVLSASTIYKGRVVYVQCNGFVRHGSMDVDPVTCSVN